MKKWIIKIGILAVLVVIVLGLLATVFIDSIVQKGVETVGPSITQTDVSLADVSLSPLSGKGELSGFVVGNPEGYKTPSAISLGRVSLHVEPGSLMSDKIVIKSFVAEAPEITIEGGLKENNLSKLLENIEAATGGSSKPEEETEDAAQTKIQIDEFILKDVKVRGSLSLLGGKTVDITLPDLEIRDLGQGEDGITAGELVKVTLNAVLNSVGKELTGSLGNIGGLGKDAGEKLKGLGKDVTKDPGKALKGIGDLLKK